VRCAQGAFPILFVTRSVTIGPESGGSGARLAQPVAGRGADQPPLPGTTKNKGHRQSDTTGMRNCRPCSSDTISPEES
jgi:hypothetical protein